MKSPGADRAKRRLMVRYGLEGLDRGAFTRNISETGMAIQTNHVYAPGTIIHVEIKFPERTFLLRARVVWAKRTPPQLAHKLPTGMGVEFVDAGEPWREFYRGWRQAGPAKAPAP